MVTCFSAIAAPIVQRPRPIWPTLYGAPPPEDPRDIIDPGAGSPTAGRGVRQIPAAVGGAAAAGRPHELHRQGDQPGYGPESEPRPVEIVAKAPAQRRRSCAPLDGDSATVFDGRSGWIAAPHRPVDVLALGGAELDGLGSTPSSRFPARIKQVADQWRVGAANVIGDREVQVVQGTGSGGALVTLSFDAESGLLVRRSATSPRRSAALPTQVDYADYREVAGVKLPFKWTVTWLDGRDVVELTDVQPNVKIDTAKFAKPAAPVTK